ncbi:hypothetical protein [Tautonia plasticadhaerens]|uniref:Uncharacterized protein n=1 Tax=Tautonia plasticadhaerens TaxID=2527974 RepID=A0A518GWB2_9BACT|nr:hypothetical protein [Tautonia plasticadhaerens]QDV32831.1 hypothetical protein ElP_06710 [Tautonia plasticadhaerens]
MADEPNTRNEYTPEQLREAKGNFDPSTLAREGEQANPQAQGKPQPTAEELAEQQRRGEKAIDQDSRTREDRLVNTGRGQHTSGRLGGNN